MLTQQTAKLAAVQASSVWLDREATVVKACRLIREAGAAGADIIAFPENFIPGHPLWFHYRPWGSPECVKMSVRLFKEAVEIPSDAVDALCEAAAVGHIGVVIGLTERIPNTLGTLYNTQLFISSTGQIIGKHQKLVATLGERLVHAPGGPETQRTFPMGLGTVSALICGENSNPLALGMISASYPVVHVASWPAHVSANANGGVRERSLLVSRSTAHMLSCFVISSCSVNSEEMIADVAVTEADKSFLRDPLQTGGTCIVNPHGQVIAGPMEGNEEGIIYADVDFDVCIRSRLMLDMAGHYNRSDVYQLRVNNVPSSLVSTSLSGTAIDHAWALDDGGNTPQPSVAIETGLTVPSRVDGS
ncbi:MAG: carbon-nitrogen hydrolase family protein [Lacisediminihabitans sp.]